VTSLKSLPTRKNQQCRMSSAPSSNYTSEIPINSSLKRRWLFMNEPRMRSYEFVPQNDLEAAAKAFLTDERLKHFSENMMASDPEGIGVSPAKKVDRVSYGNARFHNFDVREVYVNGEPNGEYHVRIPACTKQKLINAILFFKEYLKTCEVGVIDPENELRLEFQIYLKTTDFLQISTMMPTMERLDNIISNNRDGKASIDSRQKGECGE